MPPVVVVPPKGKIYITSQDDTDSLARRNSATNPSGLDERSLVASAQYRLSLHQVPDIDTIQNHVVKPNGPQEPSNKWKVHKRLKLHALALISRLLKLNVSDKVSDINILLPHIAIGNSINAGDYDGLYKIGVTHICNFDFQSPNYFEDKFIYLNIPFMDNGEDRIADKIHQFVQYLQGIKLMNGRAFLHCRTGNTLAPTFVAAYLIAFNIFSTENAIHYIRQKRPTITIHPSHQSLLKVLEMEIRQRNPTMEHNDEAQDGIMSRDIA